MSIINTANTPILNAKDILSGEQGTVWATISGERFCMMHVKNIEATVEYDKEQVPILGKRGKGNRKKGETYSGTMTVYYLTTKFRKMAEEYKQSGKDFYFDLQIENNDNTTDAGRQIVTLTDCNINSLVLAKLDADSTVLEEDMEFTFEDYRIDNEFNVLDGFTVQADLIDL